jgi:hypothetical protein
MRALTKTRIVVADLEADRITVCSLLHIASVVEVQSTVVLELAGRRISRAQAEIMSAATRLSGQHQSMGTGN